MTGMNGNGNGNLLESRVPLRSVLTMLTVLASAGGSCWFLAASFDHRLTAIESAITYGKARRDDQIGDLERKNSSQDSAIAEVERVNRLQDGRIVVLEAFQSADSKRLEGVICRVYGPGNCKREP